MNTIEEHEARVKALLEALVAGQKSGPPQPFDSDAFLKRMRKKYNPQEH